MNDPQVDFARTLVPYYYLLLPRFYIRDQTGTGSFSGSMKDHEQVSNKIKYKCLFYRTAAVNTFNHPLLAQQSSELQYSSSDGKGKEGGRRGEFP